MQDPGTVTRRPRSTAHSGQAGEHAQSALHKPQAGSTETWRLKHKVRQERGREFHVGGIP